ncbi:bifunctional UDP-sugar hydrolase/5'-nucleotidase [soil metagenome]
MSRLAVLVSAVLMAATACGLGQPPLAPKEAPSARGALAADRIQILHTNDIHGHLEGETVRASGRSFTQGGMPLLAGLARDLRGRAADRTLLLDAGDAWQGTLISSENRGQALTKIMSLMGYDAMTLGNHDFDWGQDVIAQRAKESSFPFLAANVVETATGRSPPWARPYIVKDLGIAQVAVIGLTRPDLRTVTKATNVAGLRVAGVIETVKRYMPELRSQADIVVALTHVGYDQANGPENDQALAAAVPELDVIVGGHSHPTALRTARAVGNTTVVNTGSFAQNLGRLELVLAHEKIAAVERADELVTVSDGVAQPDAAVAAIVAERRAAASEASRRVVGRTLVPLEASRDPDTPLGNLVADALLEYGRGQGWRSDVAFYNGAGVRASLPVGEITFGRLFEVLPFSNQLVGLELTGAQLRTVLEAASPAPGSAGRLHPAGVRWEFRASEPSGRRVVAAAVGDAPLDPARMYRVVTIDYLYLGGDGHTAFGAGSDVRYGDEEIEAVTAYLGAHSPVDPKADGRVVAR